MSESVKISCRCKDCVRSFEKNGKLFCRFWDYEPMTDPNEVEPEWFCSNGECTMNKERVVLAEVNIVATIEMEVKDGEELDLEEKVKKYLKTSNNINFDAEMELKTFVSGKILEGR